MPQSDLDKLLGEMYNAAKSAGDQEKCNRILAVVPGIDAPSTLPDVADLGKEMRKVQQHSNQQRQTAEQI
eukprot:13572023-Alexandrium_andersonii.AAC.1